MPFKSARSPLKVLPIWARSPQSASSGPGERGDPVTLGALAFGLVSSGAVTAAIECFKAYLSRERALVIKIKRPDGTELEITGRNVDTQAVYDALAGASLPRPG